MSLWDIIYDWFATYVFPATGKVTSSSGLADLDVITINGTDVDFSSWLCTTGTLVTLILLCVVAFLMVKWVFKLVSGAFLNIGR